MACRSAASLIISTKVRYRLPCGSGHCSEAFSSEVDTGSREENASRQKSSNHYIRNYRT
jgi:hypothetical protein